jgi:RES domain-containing protein
VQPPGAVSKSIRDEWIRSGCSAVLTLPSVLVPLEKTFLLNRKHRHFDKITIKDMSVLILDPRLR